MPGPIVPVAQPDEDEEQPTSPLVRAAASATAPAPRTAAQGPPPPVSIAPSSGYEAAALPKLPPSAPQVPVGYAPDTAHMEQLQQRVEQDRQPINPNDPSVKPKWYDRLGAALVGFGTGYREGPVAGIRAGASVLNRRYNNAEEQRTQRIAADQGALQDYDNENRLAQQAFDNSQRGYEDQVRNQELQDQQQQDDWNRNFRTTQANRQQQNADRSFNERVTSDNRNYERALQNDQFNHSNADRTYSLRKREVGVEQQRANNERERLGQQRAATQATALRRQLAANRLDQQRQQAYDLLENGDGKGSDGYRQQLKNLQTAKADAFGKPYTPARRAEDIRELNAWHDAQKQRIENSYASEMQALGYPVEAVEYGADGKPLNNSDGSKPTPTGRQTQPSSQQQPANALPKGNGRTLDMSMAKQFLAAVGGDKAKARQLAAQNGWKF